MRTYLLSGNSHGYQQCSVRRWIGACSFTKQSSGHANHRRGRAGAPDQRPDSVGTAVDLSNAQGQLRPDVHPGRLDHPDVSTDRFAIAAVGRLSHRSPSQAMAIARRHCLHPGRDSDDVDGRQLSVDSAGGGADRYRLLDLSPGGFARGATGLGRAVRAGAIDLSGRRQRRLGLRSLAGGSDHHSLWPGARGLVRSVRRVCSVRALPDQPLVRQPLEPVQAQTRPGGDSRLVQGPGDQRVGGAGAAGVLQVFLHGQFHQLLHLLPDRKIRPVGGQFATAPVPVSGCSRCGDLLRWADWRQDRAQGGDLVFDPGCRAVHPGFAARRSVLDQHPERGHRFHPGFGVLGDCGVRPGTGAG